MSSRVGQGLVREVSRARKARGERRCAKESLVEDRTGMSSLRRRSFVPSGKILHVFSAGHGAGQAGIRRPALSEASFRSGPGDTGCRRPAGGRYTDFRIVLPLRASAHGWRVTGFARSAQTPQLEEGRRMTPTSPARGRHAQTSCRIVVTDARSVDEPRPAVAWRILGSPRSSPPSSGACFDRAWLRPSRSGAGLMRGRSPERGTREAPRARADRAPGRDLPEVAANSRHASAP